MNGILGIAGCVLSIGHFIAYFFSTRDPNDFTSGVAWSAFGTANFAYDKAENK
jgi:hypothetical protein